MKIIKIQAGLGNQMFQYSLGMALQAMQEGGILFDCQEIETQGNCHNGLELESIFHVKMNRATSDDIQTLVKKDNMLWRRMLNKVYKGKYRIWICEKGLEFHPEVYVKGDRYLEGYWQSEKYFLQIKEKIHQAYQFPSLTDAENIGVAEKIRETNSVAVHIRRGDYVSVQENSFLAGICTPKYYRNAIEIMRSRYKAPKFFFFSDDIDWVRANLNVENSIYVAWNKGSDSYKDMQLMSMCKHNIIANSTFSWWSAWLNDNPDKLVIAPKCWSWEDSKDVQCDDWLLI